MKNSKLIIGGTLVLAISAIVSCILIIWGSLPLESDNVTTVQNSTLSISDPDGVVVYGCGLAIICSFKLVKEKRRRSSYAVLIRFLHW